MKIVLSLCMVWILVVGYVSGQSLTIDKIITEPVTVNTGFSFQFHSVLLNEDRTIMISLPEGYDVNTKKYPVLYMVDGQWGFNPTAQAMGWLSYSYEGKIPQTIVVTIHTKENRERDLTPTKDNENSLGGGADLFLKFMKEELVPFIDKNYRTYQYRILGGGSLGGLFVINAFVSDPNFFNSYLAFSPSMWWDNRVMLNRIEDFLLKNPGLHNRLFFSRANEGPQMGVDSLAEILKRYSPKEVIWNFAQYPEEIHTTGSYKGLWDGLKFVFADWYYPMVDFGTKENLFFLQDNGMSGLSHHKIKNIPYEIVENYSGLYLDSYGRILTLEKSGNELLFSGHRLPSVSLHPETENKFFMDETDVQNNFFLKGFDIQFEFSKEDYLIVTAHGKIEFTAKKIKHLSFVKLSDDMLDRYIGTYLASDQSNKVYVTKEGNLLKLSDTMFLGNLYPLGENKFYAFIDGSSYEIEFLKDGSMSVTENGEVDYTAKRIN